MARAPELAELLIVRRDLEYVYTLPPAWARADGGSSDRGLRQLVSELVPLLVELTGPVAIAHLAQNPALQGRGLLPAREERS
jgi:hypothetical protein